MYELELKEITKKSWLVNASGVTIAAISNVDDKYMCMTKTERKTVDSINDAFAMLGIKPELVKMPASDEPVVEKFINGYPVKHTTFTIISEEPFPIYARTNNANHCAGYWGVKFGKIFTGSFCPLHETTTKYESIGPFETKAEMQLALKQENRKK